MCGLCPRLKPLTEEKLSISSSFTAQQPPLAVNYYSTTRTVPSPVSAHTGGGLTHRDREDERRTANGLCEPPLAVSHLVRGGDEKLLPEPGRGPGCEDKKEGQMPWGLCPLPWLHPLGRFTEWLQTARPLPMGATWHCSCSSCSSSQAVKLTVITHASTTVDTMLHCF